MKVLIVFKISSSVETILITSLDKARLDNFLLELEKFTASLNQEPSDFKGEYTGRKAKNCHSSHDRKYDRLPNF